MHTSPLVFLVFASCVGLSEAGALPSRIEHVVPFTSQAPLGHWDDIRKAEGCEEASAIMAMRWVRGTGVAPDEASREIDAIVRFEQEKLGAFEDTSVQDTMRIFTEYYDHHSVELLSGVTTEDLKRVLADGAIALVPVDATKLPTPNYDGPPRHMILVHGYDDDARVFIANDPGSKSGEDFRYGYDVLEAALRNYPTGENEPIHGKDASILIVRK